MHQKYFRRLRTALRCIIIAVELISMIVSQHRYRTRHTVLVLGTLLNMEDGRKSTSLILSKGVAELLSSFAHCIDGVSGHRSVGASHTSSLWFGCELGNY